MHTASYSKGCQTLKSNYFFFLSIVASWRRSLFTHFNDNTLPLRFPIWPQIKWRMALKVGVYGCFWSQKCLNQNSKWKRYCQFSAKTCLAWGSGSYPLQILLQGPGLRSQVLSITHSKCGYLFRNSSLYFSILKTSILGFHSEKALVNVWWIFLMTPKMK